MHPARRRLAFLSAAIAAILAVVLPLSPASAAAGPGAGTRVGAPHPGMILAVGLSQPVSAGQPRCKAAPQPGLAAGACVAAEDSTSLADAAAACGGESFTAGTKVLLASGAAIPISQLKVGDEVLATNIKSGKTSPEPVSAVMVKRDTDRYNLTIRAGGKAAVIGTTRSHLFWDVTTGKWTKAAALKNGDQLRTSGRATATVLGGHAPDDAAGWMWDISVPGEGDHDFYIATSAAPVLVHNCPVGPGAPEQGSASSQSKLDRIFPGPYARAGIALENGNINDPFVREFINESGNEYGCHTCGAIEPGTPKGNWVVDELPPKALIARGTPQTAWPQCIECMHGQAGVVSVLAREVMENKW